MSIDVKEANAKRERLHGIILSVSDAARRFCEISGHDNPEMTEKLSGFAARTESDSFKILIVGEFKNGKSTFINALLGERVLPQDVLPCTAVISEVVYGEEKGAKIFFEHPLPEVISKHLHEKINAQIAAHKKDPEGIPPLEMTFEELKHVVTIPEQELLGEEAEEDFPAKPNDETKAGKEAIGKIPLSHAEIRFPLEILKDGVEIIDTPGLNEDKSREEVTRNYLKNADAIVFLFRYPKYLSMNDYASIMTLKQVHDGIFFVINAIDIAETPLWIAKLKKAALAKLVPLTSLGAEGIFFTSALKRLEMLEAQPETKTEPEPVKPAELEPEAELPAEPVRKKVNLVKNLPELEDKSPAGQGIKGMKDFEAALSKYLTENRAAAKFTAIIRGLTPELDTLEQNIDSYMQTLSKALEDAERRMKAEAQAREKLLAARKAELAKFSVERKKYSDEVARLKAEKKKYDEEVRKLQEELKKSGDELSRNAEARAKHQAAVRKLNEERSRLEERTRQLREESSRLSSEVQRLNDKTSQLDAQCSTLEAEIASMMEENRKRSEANRKRFREAQTVLYDAEELKQKIIEIINSTKSELYTSICDSMSSRYDSILYDAPSFVDIKKYDHEIGFFDALFGVEDAKRALAREIIDSLKEFFDDGISQWSSTRLKSILEDFRNDLRKKIEPNVTSFYKNIDKCTELLNVQTSKAGSNSDALSRLGSAAASASYGSAGYSTPFLVGSDGAFSESILGDVITEIFGTSIFSSILKIGDTLLSTTIHLLTFWELGDKATNAQKKAVSKGFVDQMRQQRSSVCDRFASGVSGKVMDELRSIGDGLSEEISRHKHAVKIAEAGEETTAELAEAQVREKTSQLSQLKEKRDEARRAEDAKRAEADKKSESLSQASQDKRTAEQQEQEVLKKSGTLEKNVTEAEQKKHSMEVAIAAAQGQATVQAKTADDAEERAKVAANKEAEEQKKFEDQERELREQEEKANADFKALQADMGAKITELREILEIVAIQKEELEKCQ